MSFWNKIFGKEKEVDPIDLSILKTDMHSHLVPAIDDGSKSMEDSLEMIKRFENLGFEKLITTPHVMSDFYRNTAETILTGRDQVRKSLKESGSKIILNAAAEYYLDETLESKIKTKELLTFGDNYVLFELPFMTEPPNLANFIFELQTNGYKPVLAHVERYGFWYNNFDKYQELFDKGVLLQLNMLSLIGHYSPETKKIAEKLIDQNLISLLGSDCHNVGHLNLIEVVRKKPYLKSLIESGRLKNHEL